MSQVNEFIKRVENLYEVEYGDFKRKVSLYINRLDQGVTDPSKRAIITKMRNDLLFGPIADIEIMREKTLELAKKLQ